MMGISIPAEEQNKIFTHILSEYDKFHEKYKYNDRNGDVYLQKRNREDFFKMVQIVYGTCNVDVSSRIENN